MVLNRDFLSNSKDDVLCHVDEDGKVHRYALPYSSLGAIESGKTLMHASLWELSLC